MKNVSNKDLMRRKINVSNTLLNHWKENFMKFHRNIINKSLLNSGDLGSVFEHQDRLFTLVGMTTNGTMMVSEEVDQNLVYWECTRNFVQQCLGVYNEEFSKGKWYEISYPQDTLYLPAILKRRAQRVNLPKNKKSTNSKS